MSQGSSVQILDVTQISLALLPETPPPIKLSFFDCMFACVPPIQRIMLFSNPNTNLTFPSLVQILKSSLAATLLDYLPLAGKLTYVQSTGDIEIDLSAPAFPFVEAESDLDLHQLATNEVHDVGSFVKLVPHIDVSVLPFPVFAAQVTRFGCGGLAVGYTVQHSVVDGKALLQFVNAWSKACREKFDGIEMQVEGSKPSYDRGVIKHPKGEEIARQFLRCNVPNLPTTNLSSMEEGRLHLMRRTFILDAPLIQSLRERATTSQIRSSTFLAISAYIAACIVKSKSFEPDDDVIFGFMMDCRARLNPPINDNYFGNCVRPVLVRMLVSEFTRKDGLIGACSTIRKSIDRVSKDPLSDCENWGVEFSTVPFERLVNVTASPTFRVYEADFGWGRPDRYESVSMNLDGEFALVAGREEGTVQVSVSLNPNVMEVFAESFLSGLND